MHPQEIRRRFADARVARLATVDPHGRPHLVPVTFVLDGDTVLSAVDDKPKRTRRLQRLVNIVAHPEVSLLAGHYSDEWGALWWVRADGDAEVLDVVPRRSHELLAAKYPQYWTAPPERPLVTIRVRTWRGWSAR